LGVPQREPAQAITAEILEATLVQQGTELLPGCTVAVRTGWGRPEVYRSELYPGAVAGLPGIDASATRYLADREVAAVGSDTLVVEQLAPGESGGVEIPVHRMFLVEKGIFLIENLYLEDL
jgi:kynurenine formamidase